MLEELILNNFVLLHSYFHCELFSFYQAMITKYKTLIQSEKLMINANNPDPDGSYYTDKNLQKIKI